MQEIKVTKRRMTPQQQARQLEIIDKTTGLLEKHGPQVSMEMVGEAAQVSRSTLYRYYVSREHLIAEVTLEAGNNLIGYLESRTPNGKTFGDRITFLCQQLVNMAEGSPRLLAACIHNLASDDPAVIDTHAEIEQVVARIFNTVSGNKNLEISHEARGTIFRYLLGSFMLATTGKLEFSELATDLATLCESLLAVVWDIECE